MTISERKAVLAKYQSGPKEVERALESVPTGAVDYRPFDGAWTIAEHVHHLFDSEVNGFTRYRKAVAEPGATIVLYDQEVWAAALSYSSQDLEDSLRGFGLLRRVASRHLSMIIEEDWSRYWMNHPERGRMDLDDWLTLYADHVQAHLDYIARNVGKFTER